jgi:hypothetical protein
MRSLQSEFEVSWGSSLYRYPYFYGVTLNTNTP